jgi:hypothetical protein
LVGIKQKLRTAEIKAQGVMTFIGPTILVLEDDLVQIRLSKTYFYRTGTPE